MKAESAQKVKHDINKLRTNKRCQVLENIIRGDTSQCQQYEKNRFIIIFFLDLVLMQQTATLWYWGIFIVLCLFYLLVKFSGPQLRAARTHRRV